MRLRRQKPDLQTSKWYIPWRAFREVVEMVKRADSRAGVCWWDDSPATGVDRSVKEAAGEAAESREVEIEVTEREVEDGR